MAAGVRVHPRRPVRAPDGEVVTLHWFSREARDRRKQQRVRAYEDALIHATGGKGLLISMGVPPPRGVPGLTQGAGATACDIDD